MEDDQQQITDDHHLEESDVREVASVSLTHSVSEEITKRLSVEAWAKDALTDALSSPSALKSLQREAPTGATLTTTDQDSFSPALPEGIVTEELSERCAITSPNNAGAQAEEGPFLGKALRISNAEASKAPTLASNGNAGHSLLRQTGEEEENLIREDGIKLQRQQMIEEMVQSRSIKKERQIETENRDVEQAEVDVSGLPEHAGIRWLIKDFASFRSAARNADVPPLKSKELQMGMQLLLWPFGYRGHVTAELHLSKPLTRRRCVYCATLKVLHPDSEEGEQCIVDLYEWLSQLFSRTSSLSKRVEKIML